MNTSCMLLCAALALAGASARPGELEVGKLKLAAAAAPAFRAEAMTAPGWLRTARLRVFDGRKNRSVELRGAKLTPDGPGATVRYATNVDGLNVALRLDPRGRCLLWTVSCRNGSREQQWLELGLELALGSTKGLTFFDGYRDDMPAPAEPYRTDKLQLNFPLTIAWTADAAVGIGPAPTELVSYLRHEFRPGRQPTLGSYTRIVVDAGAAVETRFVACATRGEWGKYEVFQAYYDSFPKWFRPTPGIDPRVFMGSAEYRAFPVREWSPEICRRLWAGWDWCYAPFRRTGDIVGRRELWDYKPARPFSRTRGLPRATYLAWRRKAFADGDQRCNVAMMFYVPAQIWCEERLVRQRYADALVTDPKVRTLFDRPWVTGHDNELRVFPYGTSFARQSRIDMVEVARELGLMGFAFDTAGGCARYTGPALPKLRFRAWDEDGVYCNENVAVALLMDFVHTLRGRGRPLAVVANIGAGVYTSCLHCDAAMFEGEPWKNHRTAGDRLRWKMGHKPCVWWESYGLENFIDQQSATAEKVRAVYRGLADFTLLQSLRIGFLPPPNFTQGVRRLVKWLPAMIECVQTGWEPVPALRAPKPLWTSRYGRGLRTILVAAHETGQPVDAAAAAENDRLGPAAYLFAAYWGGTLRNRVTHGETAFQVHAPVRTPVVVRAACGVEPRERVERAAVTQQNGVTWAKLVVEMRAKPGQAKVAVRVPSGMGVRSATLNGRAIAARPRAGALRFTAELRAENTLTVEFRSRFFHCADDALLGFPFVSPDGRLASLVLPGHAGPRARLAAFRIQEYFRYWYGRARQPPRDVRLPIGTSPPDNAPQVLLSLKPGIAPEVLVEGKRLRVAAATEEALHEAVLRLLYALDARYVYPDQLPATVLNRRLGLANKMLEPK